MVSKVFLFDERKWLYCSDVILKDGVYDGWAENGACERSWSLRPDGEIERMERR